MIDLRRLRDDDAYRSGIVRKGCDDGVLDELLEADAARRALLTEVEELRARQNAASKEIGQADPDERPAKIEAATALKDELSEREPRLAEAEARVRELASGVPNAAADDVPEGDEGDFVTIKQVGEETPAPPLDHADFGAALGFVNGEKAADVSGSRFAYLMREAVLLEFALVQWVMQRLVEHDFVPVVPPVLVREEIMEESGFFPTDRAQVYEVDEGELFLVGTSEVPLSGLHRREIVEGDLPLRYGGFSSCFRREAGTYGKDTRGIFRVHQFDKVELFSFVEPDGSGDEHDRILAIEEQVMRGLELHYRVVDIAVGDLGASAARKYDIEAWLPGQQAYRELTSCSNTTDYQARRLRTRYRTQGGGTELVHTLNGTAIAVPRTIIAIVEQHQRQDGSVAVPEALQPYLGREVLFSR